jgi:5,10-methylenetetrahydromethanopterin reductase
VKDVGVVLRDLTYEDALSCATRADQAGLDSVWMPENAGTWDAMLVLAALARATTNVRLATGVLPIPSRNPLQTVMAACTLDLISDGRFILGLGAGNTASLKKMGLESDGLPLRRMREFIDVCRKGIHDGEVTYSGRIYSVPEFSQTSRRRDAHVPIYVGVHLSGMLRLAGRIADGVVMNMIAPEDVRKACQLMQRPNNRTQRDRPLEVASYVMTCVGDDDEAALLAAKSVVASFCNSAIFQRRLAERDSPFSSVARDVALATRERNPEAAIELVPDEFARSHGIVGRVDVLGSRIAEYREAGVDLPILSVFPVPLKLKQFFPPLARSGAAEAVTDVIAAAAQL